MRIAIDMDETIANSLQEHLRRFNAVYGTNLTKEELQGKNLEDLLPEDEHARVRSMVRDASFFADLEVMDGAQEAVRKLAGEHQIFIASAAMEIPESFSAKYFWLRRHFPFIPVSNLVFCGDKAIIDADYLVDDECRHFRHFRGTGLLFSAPHNATVTKYLRIENWYKLHEFFARRSDTSGRDDSPRIEVIQSDQIVERRQ
jgi:5'-nucleotidase